MKLDSYKDYTIMKADPSWKSEHVAWTYKALKLSTELKNLYCWTSWHSRYNYYNFRLSTSNKDPESALLILRVFYDGNISAYREQKLHVSEKITLEEFLEYLPLEAVDTILFNLDLLFPEKK
jgi:hypothetical protein